MNIFTARFEYNFLFIKYLKNKVIKNNFIEDHIMFKKTLIFYKLNMTQQRLEISENSNKIIRLKTPIKD